MKGLKIPKRQPESVVEEGQTTQWPKEKGQTTIYKHTHTTKNRLTRIPLTTGGELMCS